jgi:hypothetical protein
MLRRNTHSSMRMLSVLHGSSSLQGQVISAHSSTSFISARFSSVTTSNSLKYVYDQFEACIEDGVKTAKAQGKEAIFVVGEDHDKKECMLMQIIALSAAYKQGINDLYIEESPRRLKRYMKAISPIMQEKGLLYFNHYDRCVIDGSEVMLNCSNMMDSYLVTKDKTNMQITAAENSCLDFLRHKGIRGHIMTSTPVLNYRDNHMVKQFMSRGQDCIAFVGAGHLKGIMENEKLNEQYHAVGFDVSGDISPKDFASYNTYQQACVLYPKNSKRVECIFPNMGLFSSMVDAVSQVMDVCEDKKSNKDIKHSMRALQV